MNIYFQLKAFFGPVGIMASFVRTISTSSLALKLLSLMCNLQVLGNDKTNDLDISHPTTSIYANFQ